MPGQDRRVKIQVDRSAAEILPRVTKEWVDEVMANDAESVLLNGVERSEPVPGDDSKRYLYFPEVTVGTYCVRIRLTCQIGAQTPGGASVQILEINPGVVGDKGEVEYQEDPRSLIDASSRVQFKWKDVTRGKGVEIQQSCLQDFVLKVPWWFPVPDELIKAVIAPFMGNAIKTSQIGVYKKIRQLAIAAAKGVAA